VDLLLLHFPPIDGCADCAQVQEQWAGMEQMYAANLTRAIGLSNYCQQCIECVLANATVKPMVNQIQYHVGQGADPAGLLTFCKEQGIVVEAYSPLAHGRLLPWAEGDALAATYGFNSSAQVAFSWIAQRQMPLVTKSDNAAYLAEDLDLFGPAQQLSATDRAAIDAVTGPACAASAHQPAPGGCCHAQAF
jgi:diketogulonate reductase-like aldo/keto reductase